MSVLHWRSEFSVGIEIVDHDHQELISRIRCRQRVLEDCADTVEIVAILGGFLAPRPALLHYLRERYSRIDSPEIDAEMTILRRN